MIKKLNLSILDVSSLVYLIFIVIPLFTFDIKGSYWAYVAIFIIFTISYVSLAIFSKMLSTQWIYICLVIHYLGIMYFVYSLGPATSLYLFFSSFLLPFILKVTMKSAVFIMFLIVLLLNLLITYLVDPMSVGFLCIMYLAILLITIGNFKQRENIKIKQALEEKNKHINVLIAEQERNRIGQDLHDTLGHVFASLSLKSELAIKLLDSDPEKAKAQMLEVNTMSKEALNKVRAIVNDLKIQSFEDEVKSMHALLNNANLNFKFQNVELANGINPSKQSLLAMLLREAINNILKHAQATCVEGRLIDSSQDITLVIEDNGVGIDHLKSDDLKSIKTRVALMHGTLDVKSDNGLCLTVKIPRGETQ
ncbi:sensor histidine kinase [Staphylococcus caeli]|uniref:sensor histidine kinase n=1 Tax=Staphylococcus caeli TaxID=2201815 RepID=UPI003F550924